MSPRQFAALVGKSYNTALDWCVTGQIAAHREGHKWEIPYEEYQRYLRQGLIALGSNTINQARENARHLSQEMKRLGLKPIRGDK